MTLYLLCGDVEVHTHLYHLIKVTTEVEKQEEIHSVLILQLRTVLVAVVAEEDVEILVLIYHLIVQVEKDVKVEEILKHISHLIEKDVILKLIYHLKEVEVVGETDLKGTHHLEDSYEDSPLRRQVERRDEVQELQGHRTQALHAHHVTLHQRRRPSGVKVPRRRS